MHGLEVDPFSHEPYSGVRKNLMKLFSQRQDWKGKRVVDLCCGDGVTTLVLRELGAQVTPYELVTDQCKLKDVPLYADVQRPLPIETGSVDMVVFQEVIEHLPNQMFALQEIARILRPGGELLLTTPSRSSLQAKLGYLVFESENLRYTPWGAADSVWGENGQGEKYYGHLWLIGVQQLRALGRIAGFSRLEVHRTELSNTSLFFFLPLYPFIALLSLRALRRDLRKQEERLGYRAEKLEQFRLNLDWRALLSKYGFYSLYK